MGRMQWQRRRDLEGGKELGIWLLLADGDVREELYVESHEYRGGDFDVYTATPDGEWDHRGTYPTATAAFAAANDYIDASEASIAEPS